MTCVLDASAVLAVLNEEPGAERVSRVLDQAVISVINLAEVAAGIIANGNSDVQARAVLAALDIETVDADEELSLDAGLLRRTTDRAGLSLGDRFCIALGRRLAAPVVTADRQWKKIEEAAGIEVLLIR